MPKGTRVEFKYQRAEVVSAQQLRYRNSPRLRVAVLFGLVALAITIARPWLPLLQTANYLSGSLPLFAAILFLGVPLVFYFLVPHLDYQFNGEWRRNYQLELSNDLARLASVGSSKWVDIDLRRLRKLLQNNLVFVLVFSNEQDFFILPKSALGDQTRSERVGRLLQSHLPKKVTRKLSQ